MQQMENVVIQFAAEWSEVYMCVTEWESWLPCMHQEQARRRGSGRPLEMSGMSCRFWGSMAMATPESQHGQHVYGGACSTLMHVYFQLPAVDCSIIHTYVHEYTYIHIPRYTFEVTHVRHIDCILQIYIFVMHIQHGCWKKAATFLRHFPFERPQ